MKDGHLNKCNLCCTTESRNNRKSKSEFYKNYEYNRQKTSKRKINKKRYSENFFTKNPKIKTEIGKRYRDKFPEKYKAHTLVNNLVRDGKLIKPNECEICNYGSDRIEAHHENYEKPLDIFWLCKKCHNDIHDRILRDKTLQKIKEKK